MASATIGLCDALARFAQECERKLRANQHKGGWSTCTMRYLVHRLGQEKAELLRAIKNGAPRAQVVAEAADVANFAMMIADVYSEPTEAKSPATPKRSGGG